MSEITPSAILDALRMGVEYSFSVTVRGLTIPFRPLSITEEVNVRNEVLAEMAMLKPHEQHALSEASRLSIKTLELASTKEPGKEAPRLTGYTLSKMTSDELRAVYNAYGDACDRLNPRIEKMSQEQIKALIDEAKKNASTLTQLPASLLEQMVRTLIADTSPQANMSGG